MVRLCSTQVLDFEIALLLTLYPLPNYSIRSRQHVRRNCEADLLSGWQVNYEFKLRGLFHGQVRGLGAFEDFIYVSSGASEQVRKTHS